MSTIMPEARMRQDPPSPTGAVGRAWSSFSRSSARWGPPTATILFVLVVWQIVVEVFKISPLILPDPLRVLTEFFTGLPELLEHGMVTFQESVLGLLFGAVLGVILAVVLDQIALARRGIFPLLLISQMVPAIVFAPILLVWFGFDLTAKTIIAVIVCIFPIVINTTLGFRSVPHEMDELADSVSSSNLRRLLKIRLPFAAPYFFASLKPATTLAIIGAIIGEFLGGTAGLGYLIVRDIRFLSLPHMFATVVAIVVMGMVIYALVFALEQLVLRSRPPARRV